MSHVASVKCYCSDVNDAKKAAAELGLELVEAKTYAWFGSWVGDYRGEKAAVDNGYDPATFGTCDYKIRIPGAPEGTYEIGLVKRADGKPGWELLYDNWSSGGRALHEKAGVGLALLKDGIAKQAAIRTLSRQGYRVVTRINPTTGKLQVIGQK